MATALNPEFTPIWPLTVGQYHAMIDMGILGPDDPVELLEGVIVQKMSKNPPHRIATRATRQALERIIPQGWYVDEQEPITLGSSEPEPDVAVIRGDTRDYVKRHPGTGDAGLVVEISDATADRDRLVKKRICAVAGIGCYWLIDLNRRQLEVYTNPVETDYLSCMIYRAGDLVEVTLNGMIVGPVPVRDLLP